LRVIGLVVFAILVFSTRAGFVARERTDTMSEMTDTIMQDIARAGFDPASWAKDVHVDRAALAEGG
jgi:hypothetical protein